MKKMLSLFLLISLLFILGNWGVKRTSEVSGDRLHRINFYGRIITVANQDKEPEIDNISIENLYRQIPFYASPTTPTEDINTKKHIIASNPKDILQQVKLDLSETKTIETKRIVGNSVIWKYMDEDKTKKEYIELIIISKDETKNNYLIEMNKQLYYNEKSAAGPKESKINFKGLIKLTIDGYKDREMEANNC